MKVVVRRSGWKMWIMAMAGIPLLVIAVDILYTRSFSDRLREIVFDGADTQVFEARDVLYAWIALAFAALFLVWGLKELFLPTSVLECLEEGLSVRIGSPVRGPTVIPWSQIVDIRADEAEDEGTSVPLLTIDLRGAEGIPRSPWGGRWLTKRRLAVLADNWSESPGDVARQIFEYAGDRITGAWPTSGTEEE